MSTEQPKPDETPVSASGFRLSLDWWAVITALVFTLLILLNIITVSW